VIPDILYPFIRAAASVAYKPYYVDALPDAFGFIAYYLYTWVLALLVATKVSVYAAARCARCEQSERSRVCPVTAA
jgi:hypothetical protein